MFAYNSEMSNAKWTREVYQKEMKQALKDGKIRKNVSFLNPDDMKEDRQEICETAPTSPVNGLKRLSETPSMEDLVAHLGTVIRGERTCDTTSNSSPKLPRLKEVADKLYNIKSELFYVSCIIDEAQKDEQARERSNSIENVMILDEVQKWKQRYEEEVIKSSQLASQVEALQQEKHQLLQKIDQLSPPKNPTVVEVSESSFPIEDNDEDVRVRNFKRCIGEIINTEVDYVNDLVLIQEVFITPLTGTILSHEESQALFSNVMDISKLNEELLSDLREMQDSVEPKYSILQHWIPMKTGNSNIGQIFMRYAEFFKMYTDYCTNHTEAIRMLGKMKNKNKQLELFLRKAKINPRCRLLTLEAFLMKPIQRICKYPLLLKELLKYTADDDPLKETLTATQAKVYEVVNTINERKKEAESMAKVVEIRDSLENLDNYILCLVEPSRRFISEGVCTIIQENKTFKDHKVFLFNDLIVFAKPLPLKRKSYQFKGFLELAELVVRDITDDEKYTNAFEVLSLPENQLYTFCCKSDQQKTEWVPIIEERATVNFETKYKKHEKQIDDLFRKQNTTKRTKSYAKLLSLLVKEGYLQKLHGNLWKKRYFELKDGYLYRFEEKGGRLLHKLFLGNSSIEEFNEADEEPTSFIIKTEFKSITLKADTEEEMHEWLNCIMKNKLLGDNNIEKGIAVETRPHDGSVIARASFRLKNAVRTPLNSISFAPSFSSNEK